GVDDLALPDRDPKPQRRIEPRFVLNGCIVAHRILPLFCQMPIAAEPFPLLCTPLTTPWTQEGARNGRPASIPGDREGHCGLVVRDCAGSPVTTRGCRAASHSPRV